MLAKGDYKITLKKTGTDDSNHCNEATVTHLMQCYVEHLGETITETVFHTVNITALRPPKLTDDNLFS